MRGFRSDLARVGTLIRDARMCDEAAHRRLSAVKHDAVVREFARQAAAYLWAEAERIDPRRIAAEWKASACEDEQ